MYLAIDASLFSSELDERILQISSKYQLLFEDTMLAGGYTCKQFYGRDFDVSDVDLFVKGMGRVKLDIGVDIIGVSNPDRRIEFFDMSILQFGIYTEGSKQNNCTVSAVTLFRDL